jgi:hypothetical protein
MKHFALVGLFAALLAARLEGQIVNLFEITVNQTESTVTIIPTSPPATVSVPYLQAFVSLSLNDGITLLNFFPNSFPGTTGTHPDGVTIPSTLKVYQYSADPLDPNSLPDYFPFPATFDKMAVLQSVFQTSGLVGDTYGNPSVTGGHLNLFNLARSDFQLFDLRFSKPGESSSVTISFTPGSLNSFSSESNTGPRFVYGGQNTAFPQEDSGTTYNSFLGTYTLTVVPEPSTYAAIAGGLGLAAAVIHRRRQRAKAAQG